MRRHRQASLRPDRSSIVHPKYQTLLTILERFVSRVNARMMLQRAIEDVGSSTTRPTDEELLRVATRLRSGMALFIQEDRRAEATRLIADACGEAAPTGTTTIPIKAESDVSIARVEARRLCESLGTNGFTVQKITTIVSELARNIVSYTEGGAIEMSPREDGVRRVHLVATDSGRGIANIDEVLSGSYRSRTGLGRGILGCRKLADRFDIETGDRGTRIRVEIRI